MSNSFIVCIEAVVPMFLLLAVGYLARIFKLTDDELSGKMNSLCFKLLFPFLMFNNIASSHIGNVNNLKLILFAVLSLLIVYVADVIFVLCFEKKNTSRGAMIQAIYRSNFVIMGLPIAINIYGNGNVGITAVLIAVIVPIFNILAIITLEVFRKARINIKDIFVNICKNPLIIGAVFGIVFSVFNIELPKLINGAVSDISSCATPIALMILGSSFKFEKKEGMGKNITAVILGRLIIVPGIVLTIGAALGFRNIEFISLVGIFAAPCAISSYTMAREMESDYELAGDAVVFTSAISCVTMFLWLYIFKCLGVF